MAEDHQVTIDGQRWLQRFTRLRGDAAGWTYFDNARRQQSLNALSRKLGIGGKPENPG